MGLFTSALILIPRLLTHRLNKLINKAKALISMGISLGGSDHHLDEDFFSTSFGRVSLISLSLLVRFSMTKFDYILLLLTTGSVIWAICEFVKLFYLIA